MKKSSTIAAISFALFLSACTPVEEPQVSENQQQPLLQQPTENQTEVSENGTENEEAAIVENDSTIVTTAILQNDATICQNLSDTSLVADCESRVSESEAYAEAVQSMDVTQCETLSPSFREACESKVQMKLEGQAQFQSEMATDNGDSAEITQIIASGNVEQCVTLALETSVQSCELGILVQQAVEARDDSVCEQASQQASIDTCKSVYQQEIEYLQLAAGAGETSSPQ